MPKTADPSLRFSPPTLLCSDGGTVLFKNTAARKLLSKPHIRASLLPHLPSDAKAVFFPQKDGRAVLADVCGILTLSGSGGPVGFLAAPAADAEGRYLILVALPYLSKREPFRILKEKGQRDAAKKLASLALHRYAALLLQKPGTPSPTEKPQRHLWDLAARCALPIHLGKGQDDGIRSVRRLFELLECVRDRLWEPLHCPLELRSEIPESEGVYLSSGNTFLSTLLFCISFAMELSSCEPGCPLPCLHMYLQQRMLHFDLCFSLSKTEEARLPHTLLKPSDLQVLYPSGELIFSALTFVEQQSGVTYRLLAGNEAQRTLRVTVSPILDKRKTLYSNQSSKESDFLAFLAYLCL